MLSILLPVYLAYHLGEILKLSIYLYLVRALFQAITKLNIELNLNLLLKRAKDISIRILAWFKNKLKSIIQ